MPRWPRISTTNRRPYAKTSRRRACEGRRRQSQEVNNGSGIAGATLVLATFSDHGSLDADAQPHRQFLDDPHRRRRPAGTGVHAGSRAVIAAVGVPLLMLMPAAIARQHDPAPPGMVRRIAEAEILESLASSASSARRPVNGQGIFKLAAGCYGRSATGWRRSFTSIRRKLA